MPILVTFDLVRPEPLELNRIRGAFERLGWQRVGNTAYRYPALHRRDEPEDWFNHVIPALMLLRALSRHGSATDRGLRQFSIDVQSSTAAVPEPQAGALPLAG